MTSIPTQQLKSKRSANFSRPNAYADIQQKRYSGYATNNTPFVLGSTSDTGASSTSNIQKELPLLPIPQENSTSSSGGIGHLSDSEDEDTRKAERQKNAFGQAVEMFSKIIIREGIQGRKPIAQKIQKEIEAQKIAMQAAKGQENLSTAEMSQIVNAAIAEQIPSPEKLLKTAKASPNVMETAHIIHGMNQGLALVYNPIQDILEKAQQTNNQFTEQKTFFEGQKLASRGFEDNATSESSKSRPLPVPKALDESGIEKSLDFIKDMKKQMEELTDRRVKEAVEPLVETARGLFREAIDQNEGTKSDTYIRLKSYCKALSETESSSGVEKAVGNAMLGEMGKEGPLEKMVDAVAQENLEIASKGKASSIKSWMDKMSISSPSRPKFLRKKTGSSISEPHDAEGAGLDRNDLFRIRTNDSQ